MEARLNAQQLSPTAYAAMIGLETFVRKAFKQPKARPVSQTAHVTTESQLRRKVR